MIDKLDFKIKSEFDLPSFVGQLEKEATHKKTVLDKDFNDCVVYYRGDTTLLTLKLKPKYYNTCFTQIETNPSHYSGINEYKAIAIPDADIDSFEIKRIDHASDLSIPIQTLFESCRAKGKQLYKDHFEKGSRAFKGAHLNGFYFGDKPEIVVCYDRACRLRERYKFKPIPIQGKELGHLSRIEVRHFKSKVSISKPHDIPKLLDINPFSNFEIYEFLDTDKGNYLRDRSKAYGFHILRSQLNTSNNFNRTYSTDIRASPLQGEIVSTYVNKLQAFLKNNFNKGEGNAKP